jgi:hypothetical protein
MTSPRDETLERMAAAAKGIRKEWRVVDTAAGRRTTTLHVSEDHARRSAEAIALIGGYTVVVESRHVTPWQPDPGVGVAQPEGEAGQRTPTPADPGRIPPPRTDQ